MSTKPRIQFAVVQANDMGVVHYPGGIDTAQVEPEAWCFMANANGKQIAIQLKDYPDESKLSALIANAQAMADL